MSFDRRTIPTNFGFMKSTKMWQLLTFISNNRITINGLISRPLVGPYQACPTRRMENSWQGKNDKGLLQSVSLDGLGALLIILYSRHIDMSITTSCSRWIGFVSSAWPENRGKYCQIVVLYLEYITFLLYRSCPHNVLLLARVTLLHAFVFILGDL